MQTHVHDVIDDKVKLHPIQSLVHDVHRDGAANPNDGRQDDMQAQDGRAAQTRVEIVAILHMDFNLWGQVFWNCCRHVG